MITNIVAEKSVRIYPPRMKGLGEKVKNLRVEMRLSQQQLADIVGVNIETINRIEHDQNTTLKMLCSIAKALKVKVGDLLPVDQSTRGSKPAPVVPFSQTDFQRDMHRKLQVILESDYQAAIMVNVEAIHQYAAGLPPTPERKLKHYSPNEPIMPGDVVELPDGRVILVAAVRSA